MEKQILIDNAAVPVSETKVQFGAVSAPTPVWASWLFRSVFILTSAVTIWIAGTELISKGAKVEWMLLLKMADALAFGFSKLFGIVPNEDK